MSHCHDEANHDHGHNHGQAHDHSDDIQPALQYSLYQHIIFDQVTCLNESAADSGRAVVKKTWAERLEPRPEVVSDADEQLLLQVPFTGQVKLHAILIRSSTSGTAPMRVRVFANRDDLDFTTASEATPTQELHLAQTSAVQELPVQRARFGQVQHLTLFFVDNYGEECSCISYLGFRGDWMPLGRAPAQVLYEAAPNPRDHAVKGTNVNPMGSRLGGDGS
ncbi:hypothetical protein K3495_g14421 [Podosphaera aphanis]|nr:hypothetical protein K3495_g14421 [Podosphaera aphanis]